MRPIFSEDEAEFHISSLVQSLPDGWHVEYADDPDKSDIYRDAPDVVLQEREDENGNTVLYESGHSESSGLLILPEIMYDLQTYLIALGTLGYVLGNERLDNVYIQECERWKWALNENRFHVSLIGFEVIEGSVRHLVGCSKHWEKNEARNFADGLVRLLKEIDHERR